MKLTLVHAGRRIEAAAFSERVQRSIAALRTLGLKEGGVLALMLHNTPAMLELMLAARSMGAIWCPINWHFKQAELAYILRDSGASVLVAEAALLDALAEALPTGLTVLAAGAHPRWPLWDTLVDNAAPDTRSPAAPRGAMLYTSGTTGLPKGIRRQPATPAQAQRALQRSRFCYGYEPGMRALLSAPMYHSAPNSFAVNAAQADDALMVLEPRFDPERTLQLIEQHRITHAYLVPTMYVRLLKLPEAVKRRHDLSSMRFVSSTGSPCAPDVKQAMIDWWGPVFHESYGSSELGYMTRVDSVEAQARPGTAGRALEGVDLAILDDAGAPLPPGQRGMIYARQHDAVDFTYVGNEAARRAMERDGFLTMGDVGYLDDDGYLFIVDRAADMVISGGVNIYPVEIEKVLLAMPGVDDCAVFGIPHDEFGEALAAAVQRRPGSGVTEDEVKAFVRERLAGYKTPAVVTFHDALPREETGKIFKRRLREPYWAGRTRRV